MNYYGEPYFAQGFAQGIARIPLPILSALVELCRAAAGDVEILRAFDGDVDIVRAVSDQEEIT